MEIKVPELALVLMVGVTGSGKSTLAKKLFKPTEIISSDYCRAMVSDDENDQSATNDAFELLRQMVRIRLKRGLLTVIDATNVQPEARKQYAEIAREFHVLLTAIVLDLPEKVLRDRTAARTDRDMPPHVIPKQRAQLRKSLGSLKYEGYRNQYVFRSEEEVAAISGIVREPLYNNKKHLSGPFDLIGDVHGCFDELQILLTDMGYSIKEKPYNIQHYGYEVTPPIGRTAIFLGDLVDRGPKVPEVLKLAMSMVKNGSALCVPGNHDVKLLKRLNGGSTNDKHGILQSLEQLEKETPEFISEVKSFLDSLISHYVLDAGKLVVCHAGIREEMHGRGSGAIRAFCLYGETTGETDEYGLPVRYNWALEYTGKAVVAYGHTPVLEAQWLNNTICLDTGCVFGGKLTAMRYPERQFVSVAAKEVYCEPIRPLHSENAVKSEDRMLHIEDVTGKRHLETRLIPGVQIRQENSIAALEVMSRFAVDPRWLIYLPPTMSPTETSDRKEFLEFPSEAFSYYREEGIEKVVCEEKHMGSRVLVVIAQSELAVEERFGIRNQGIGVCFTRTGRNFFNDEKIEKEFLQRVKLALDKSDFWNRFTTQWVCLDAELMPWSAKAQGLLRDQYAAVGAAAEAALPAALDELKLARERGLQVDSLLKRFEEKISSVDLYRKSYRQYCWNVSSLNDMKLAPFHILATEGAVHVDKTHEWHMQEIANLCEADLGFMHKTPYRVVDLSKEQEVQSAIEWWLELTGKGGEGMVVKPEYFIARGKKGIVQPAIKCRGREYLRIIYGPEYTHEENMTRLRARNIKGKRSLAMREFALGVEGLERFVKHEALKRVHECIFGVLALESESIDPRL
jgi:polynucleotide kinase-phosphatase